MAAIASIDVEKRSKKAKVNKKTKNALITEDDVRCEMCGEVFLETEVFMRHIETEHGHQCKAAGCELSFTHEYFLHLHEAEIHKSREPPNISLKPAEEKSGLLNSTLTSADKFANDSSILESTLDISSTFGDSLNISSALFQCDDCTEAFPTSLELDEHVTENHYTYEQASSHCQTYRPSLKCTFPHCQEVFENAERIKKHFEEVHDSVKTVPARRSSNSYDLCTHCNKSFSGKRKFILHQEIEHKYKCDLCPRSYILQPDLLHHILKYHESIDSDAFTCKFCEHKFSDEGAWRQHEAAPHEHACTMEECLRSFCDRRQLEIHLSQEHDVLHVTIDSSRGTKGLITKEKSQSNADIAKWAEEWIR